MDNADATQSILELIDACTQCRQIFHVSYETSTDSTCKELIEKLEQKLDQFGIELRNEFRRLDMTEEDLTTFRFEPTPNGSAILALRHTLDQYEQAISNSVTLRAMITRQHSDIQLIYEQFVSLCQAA